MLEFQIREKQIKRDQEATKRDKIHHQDYIMKDK